MKWTWVWIWTHSLRSTLWDTCGGAGNASLIRVETVFPWRFVGPLSVPSARATYTFHFEIVRPSMNKRDAKALGRWCDRHNRQHERVQFPGGARSTMCPECAKDGEFAEAIDALTRAAYEWWKQGFPKKEQASDDT